MSSGQDKRKVSPVEARESDTRDNMSSDMPVTRRGKVGRGDPKTVHGRDGDMGAALRSAYQLTVNEAVPDEMLDLLGKLD